MCAIGQRIKNMILTKFAIVNVTNIDGLHASGADRLQSQIRVFVWASQRMARKVFRNESSFWSVWETFL